MKNFPDFMTMDEVEERLTHDTIYLGNWELEHLLWRLFLVTRNSEKLPFKDIFSILNTKQLIKSGGGIADIEQINMDGPILSSARAFSKAYGIESENSQLEKLLNNKIEFYKKFSDKIVLWDTP